MSQALELRVLSGIHAGACCEIFDKAVLGTDPGCDIVLTDEGIGARAAQVCIGASGWHLAQEPGAPFTETLASRFNQPLKLGPVWITVTRPADPWMQAAADSGRPDGMAHGPDEPTLSASRDAPDPAAVASVDDTDVPSRNVMPEAAAQHTHRRWPMILGLCSVVLSVLLAIVLVLLPGPAETQPAGADTGRLAVEQSVERIHAVIERLGLASRVQVSVSDNSLATVSGWVRDTAEQDELATALAQIWPMPAMRVSSEADIVHAAQLALSAFPVRYHVQARGDGQFDIRGIAPDAEQRSAALHAARIQAPGMAIASMDIRLAPEIAEAFAARLREAQISDVTLDWRQDQLHVVPRKLATHQQRTLLGLVEQFNVANLDVVTVVLPPVSAMADSVPFGIRSVVGGTQPYLVLADGTKLLPGGTYDSYLLQSIEVDRIVFGGHQPATVAR